VARKKGSDDFLPNGPRPLGSFKPISNIIGSDKKSQLLRPLPFKRRFRPATNTKDYSVVSDYNMLLSGHVGAVAMSSACMHRAHTVV